MIPTCRKVLAITTLLYAMSIAFTAWPPAAAEARQAGAASASQQDKMKACNDLADKKGLKGDDRKNFLHSCISKTTDVQPLSDASQKDKMNAGKNLADKRNLKGEDRRSFIKDCLNKANSK
jgi:psiF repeat